MIGDSNIAEDGSVAIRGDNSGDIKNYSAINGGTIIVNNISPQTIRRLPSLLSSIILNISEQSLSEYSKGERRKLPPGAVAKLHYNNIDIGNTLMRDHARFSLALERAYRGVEQRNSDARFLVIRKAGIVYVTELDRACAELGIAADKRDTFARNNSTLLVQKVVEKLIESYVLSHDRVVEEEVAHLAVSLIVADAIVECEVLQRPYNVASS